MSALVTFVEVIGVLWIAGTVLVLVAGAVTGRQPRRVSERQAQCNARPTSSAVNTIYDRAPLADVVNIEWAREASAGLRQPAQEGGTATNDHPALVAVPHPTPGGDAA